MKHLPSLSRNFAFAVRFYLMWVAVFTVARAAQLLLNLGNVEGTAGSDIFRMFVVGLRFDTVICCYLLILPLLLISVETFTGREIKALRVATMAVAVVESIPVLLLLAADIPYYQHFGNRFNVMAFDGLGGNFGTVFKMIVEEPTFGLMIIPAIAVGIVVWIVLKKIIRSRRPAPSKHIVPNIIYTLMLLVLLFFGMRGNANFKTRPIQPGLAFFSNNQTVNQLGLNPCYVFIRSLSRQDQVELHFCDDDEAIAEVQRQLGITTPDASYPILRKISPQGTAHRYNVVFVIMEGMSANNLSHHGYPKAITPFLDSLLQHSLYFENCYTSGDRTCLGTYSSVVSFPTIYGQHPMYNTPVRTFNSIAYELKANGYATNFFVSHNKNFDNTNAFMMANGFDRLYSEEDYPPEALKTIYGAPDDYLLDFAVRRMDTLANDGTPFLATILTVSNHQPYYIPEKYRDADKSEWEQAVAFSDDALRQFFAQAATRTWFDSTLFVLVADHGNANDNTYPLSISYFHSPLIFYAPAFVPPQSLDCMAQQTDIFPTIMGILGLPYYNNTFGIDLLREKRPYSSMMNSSGYGIIGKEWYLVYLTDSGKKSLYHYRDGDPADHIAQHPDIADSMDSYVTKQWQAATHILKTGKTFYKH